MRVDSSLNGPGPVPESYDPLFAKLIVRGSDRADALRRLRRALAEFRVEGISTTLPFHRALLDDDGLRLRRLHDGLRGGADVVPLDGGRPLSATMAAAEEKTGRTVEVEVNGKLFRVVVYGSEEEGRGGAPRRKGATTRRTTAVEGSVVAPMQGTIVKVLVEEGQEIAADEAVCVLEAMKMESEIRAPSAGKVARVLVETGKAVRSGEPLLVLE